MTKAEMRTMLKALLGNNTLITDALCDTLLSLALTDVAAWRNWSAMFHLDETVDTVADQFSYNLTGDIKDVLQIVLQDDQMSRRLEFLPPVDFRRRFPNIANDSSGRPQYYTIESGTMTVYPAPMDADLTFSIMQYRWPADMATDATVCPLPKLESALIHRAAAYGAGMLRQVVERNLYANIASKQLRRMSMIDGDPSAYIPIFAGGSRYCQSMDNIPVVPAGVTL